jgi:hypothetical protein
MAELNGELYVGLMAFLEAEGMRFDITPGYSDIVLRQRVGEERFQAFCHTMDDVRDGIRPIHDGYAQFQSVQDANTLMSAQADALLACNVGTIEVSGVLALEGGRVGELGCYSGSVLRHLAQRKPQVRFTGFDRLPELLDASLTIAPPNCDFQVWDYQSSPRVEEFKFDALFGTFCIDFETHVQATIEAEHFVLEVNRVVADCAAAFAHWRGVVMDGGCCTVALRLGTVHAFSGACQAAWLTGWEVDFVRSRVVRAGGEQFPILAMSAGAPQQSSTALLHEVIEGWERMHADIFAPPSIALPVPSRALKRDRQQSISK